MIYFIEKNNRDVQAIIVNFINLYFTTKNIKKKKQKNIYFIQSPLLINCIEYRFYISNAIIDTIISHLIRETLFLANANHERSRPFFFPPSNP